MQAKKTANGLILNSEDGSSFASEASISRRLRSTISKNITQGHCFENLKSHPKFTSFISTMFFRDANIMLK
jgi:hypothetical protein